MALKVYMVDQTVTVAAVHSRLAVVQMAYVELWQDVMLVASF